MTDGGYIYKYSDIRYDGSLLMDESVAAKITDANSTTSNYLNINLQNFNQYKGAAGQITGAFTGSTPPEEQQQIISSQFNVCGLKDVCIPISKDLVDKTIVGDGRTTSSFEFSINIWFSLNGSQNGSQTNKVKFTIPKGTDLSIYYKDSRGKIVTKDIGGKKAYGSVYLFNLSYLYTKTTNKPGITYSQLQTAYKLNRGLSLAFTLAIDIDGKPVYYVDTFYQNGIAVNDIGNSYWNQYTNVLNSTIESNINSLTVKNLLKKNSLAVQTLAKDINSRLTYINGIGSTGHFANTKISGQFTHLSDPIAVNLDYFYTMFTVQYIDVSGEIKYNGCPQSIASLKSGPNCESTEDYFTFPYYFGSSGYAYNVNDNKPIITGKTDIPSNDYQSGNKTSYSLYLSGTLNADKIQRYGCGSGPKVLSHPDLPGGTVNTWSTSAHIVKTLVPYDELTAGGGSNALNNVLKSYNTASDILDNVVQYSKKTKLQYSQYYALISPIIWTLVAKSVFNKKFGGPAYFGDILTGYGNRLLDFAPASASSYTRGIGDGGNSSQGFNYMVNILNNDYNNSIEYDQRYCNPYGQQNPQSYAYTRNNLGNVGSSLPATLKYSNTSRNLCSTLDKNIIFDFTGRNCLFDNTNHLFITYNGGGTSSLIGNGPLFVDNKALQIRNGYDKGSDIGSVLQQWGGLATSDPANTFQGQFKSEKGTQIITGKGKSQPLSKGFENNLNYGASLLCQQYRINNFSFNICSEGIPCFSYGDGYNPDSSVYSCGACCSYDRSFNIGLIGYSTFNPWIQLSGTIQINSIYSTGSDAIVGAYSCSSQKPFLLLGTTSMTYTYGSDAPELTATGSTMKNGLFQVGDDAIKLGADCLSVDNALIIQGNVGGNTVMLGAYGGCNGQITQCSVSDIGIAYLNIYGEVSETDTSPRQPNYQAILAGNNQNYGGVSSYQFNNCQTCGPNNYGCPYQKTCNNINIIPCGGNNVVTNLNGSIPTTSKICRKNLEKFDLKGYSIEQEVKIQPVSNLSRAGGSIKGNFKLSGGNPSGSTISIKNIIADQSVIAVTMLSTYLSPYNATGSFTSYYGVYLDTVVLNGAKTFDLDFSWTTKNKRGFFKTVSDTPTNYNTTVPIFFAGGGIGGPSLFGVPFQQPSRDKASDSKNNRIIYATTLQGGVAINSTNIETAPTNYTCSASVSSNNKDLSFYYNPKYVTPMTISKGLNGNTHPIYVNGITVANISGNSSNYNIKTTKALISYNADSQLAVISDISDSSAIEFKADGNVDDPLFNPLPTSTSIIKKRTSCNQLDTQFVNKPIVAGQTPSKTVKRYYNQVLAQLFGSTPTITVTN